MSETSRRSRRERPAKPALSRQVIVDVARQVMDAEGLERVTMRRLAQELDTGPASLYVYVANTAELHGAILDDLLRELPAPAPGTGWREELVQTLVAYTETLFAHPGLARSVLVLRPAGPHYLRLLDDLLGLLHRGRVPRAQAAWGVDLLLQLATATAAEHAPAGAGAPDEPAQDAAQVAAVRDVDAASYPEIARVGTALLDGDPQERLQWAFRAALAGICATPPRSSTR
ncbi:MAG: TetR/AcrR family transcriptional regulator [Motilibacteraceae bacterium]